MSGRAATDNATRPRPRGETADREASPANGLHPQCNGSVKPGVARPCEDRSRGHVEPRQHRGRRQRREGRDRRNLAQPRTPQGRLDGPLTLDHPGVLATTIRSRRAIIAARARPHRRSIRQPGQVLAERQFDPVPRVPLLKMTPVRRRRRRRTAVARPPRVQARRARALHHPHRPVRGDDPRRQRGPISDLADRAEHPPALLQSACPPPRPDKDRPRQSLSGPRVHLPAPTLPRGNNPHPPHVAGTQQCCAPTNSTTTSLTT